MNKKKILISVLLFSIISAGGYLFLQKNNTKENTQSSTFTKNFKIERGNITKSISSDGLIELLTYDLSFERTGIIKNIQVKEGDVIEKGQVLGTLEDKDYITALNNANTNLKENQLKLEKNIDSRKRNLMSLENNLASAQNIYDNSKLDYEKALALKDSYSIRELDDLKSAVDTALKNYEIKKSEYEFEKNSNIDEELDELAIQKSIEDVKSAKDNLTNSSLISSVSGTIVKINKKEGEKIQDDEIFIRLGNKDDIQVVTEVSEVDIEKIKNSMEVSITLEAFPKESFSGVVSKIDFLSSSSKATSFYNVYIDLNETDKNLRDGMNASVEFVLEQQSDVLLIPSAAISRSNKKTIVKKVNEDGSLSEHEVEIGIQNDLVTEIISGLKEGDSVQVEINLQNSSNGNNFRIPMGAGIGDGPVGGSGSRSTNSSRGGGSN